MTVDKVMARFKVEAETLLGSSLSDDMIVGFSSEEEMLPWALEMVASSNLLAGMCMGWRWRPAAISLRVCVFSNPKNRLRFNCRRHFAKIRVPFAPL